MNLTVEWAADNDLFISRIVPAEWSTPIPVIRVATLRELCQAWDAQQQHSPVNSVAFKYQMNQLAALLAQLPEEGV